MAKFNYIQNAFTAGQLSEKMVGRSDLETYQQGLREILNCFTLRQGGAGRRPGFRYIHNSLTEKTRLIPFVLSKTEAYLVCLRNGTSTVNIYDQAGAAQTVNNTLESAADIYGWQYVQTGDVMILCHDSSDYQPRAIQRDSGTGQFSILYIFDPSQANRLTAPVIGYDQHLLPMLDANITATTITPSAASGTVTLTASTSIFTSDHVGAFFKLTQGTSATGIARVTAYTSGTQVTAVTMTNFASTAATDNWEESAWSDHQGWPKSVTLFESRLIFGGNKLNPDTVWGSRVGNFFHFMGKVFVQDLSTDASGLDFFGSVTEDFPVSFTIASQEVNPIQWLSSGATLQIGTLGAEYIATGGSERILSALNVSFILQTSHGSKPQQPIRVGTKLLFVSRDGKRWRSFQFDDEQKTYNTTNLNLISEGILNHNLGNTDEWSDVEILDFAYQESRGIVWVITNKNQLVALTLDDDAKTAAWSGHTIGGADVKVHGVVSIPNTDGAFDDLWCVIERTVNSSTVYYLEKMGPDLEHPLLKNTSTKDDDQAWFSDSALRVTLPSAVTSAAANITPGTDNIAATNHGLFNGMRVQVTTTGTLPTGISASTDYYVIVVDANNFKLAETRNYAIAGTPVLDITATGSGNHTYTPFDSTVWEDFTHLEGESVIVLADGFHHPPVTVSSGSITLNEAVTEVIVGLSYTSRLKTMPLEAGKDFESSQGQTKRIDQVLVRFYKTYGAKIGKDENTLDEISFRDGAAVLDDPPVLFTGDKLYRLPQTPDRTAQVVIEQDNPLPFTVLSLIMRGISYD